MLGQYSNFPEDLTRLAQFTYTTKTQTLQAAIASALQKLNTQPTEMNTITKSSPTNCNINFEFGVAEGNTFNFLDQDEVKKLEATLKLQALQLLDFFWVTRCHIKAPKGKTKSLKFDYDMLRFQFAQNSVDLFIHHERGMQRIPRKDFILFIKNKIDQELTQRQQQTLTLSDLF